MTQNEKQKGQEPDGVAVEASLYKPSTRDLVFAFAWSPICFAIVLLISTRALSISENLVWLPIAIICFGYPITYVFRASLLFPPAFAMFSWFVSIRSLGERLTLEAFSIIVALSCTVFFLVWSITKGLRRVSTRLETSTWLATTLMITLVPFGFSMLEEKYPVQFALWFESSSDRVLQVAFFHRDLDVVEEYVRQTNSSLRLELLSQELHETIVQETRDGWDDGIEVLMEGIDPALLLESGAVSDMYDVLKWKLDKGLDPNLPIKQGSSTALHLSSTLSKSMLLVAHGADLNSRDDEGNSPLEHARRFHAETDLPIYLNGPAEKHRKNGPAALTWATPADSNLVGSRVVPTGVARYPYTVGQILEVLPNVNGDNRLARVRYSNADDPVLHTTESLMYVDF